MRPDVTRILQAVERGDERAAEQLLPIVYDELRALAEHRMAGESPGQTLQATALVHEAYLRLVGDGDDLYEAWHAAEPDKGYDAKAAEWRAKLQVLDATSQPAAVP